MNPEAEPADAFTWNLIQDHAPALGRFVDRLIPSDAHWAEDVVQETMLRAWRHQDTLTTGTSLRLWLFMVAKNIAIDWHRRRQARPTEVDVEEACESDWIDVDRLENVLHRRVLTDVMATIPFQHREILILLYYADLTQAQVAATLGIAQGTVKSRAHYALRQTRREMTSRGIVSLCGSVGFSTSPAQPIKTCDGPADVRP